jgi:hypothetical protein
MNIGFDLDKIFIDYPPVVPSWIIDKLYKLKDNGSLEYRIPGKPEQKLRQLSHTRIFRPVIKNNMQFLKMLSLDKKHSLFLVSSRFGFLKKQTDALAKRHNFKDIFTSIHFNFDNNQPHEFKKDVLKQLHLDRYVDDDLSLLKYLSSYFPKTIFYWLNSHSRDKILKNVKGITRIQDVLE